MGEEADFAAILETSKRWMDAWIAQDRETLETILADDYSLLIASAPERRFERDEWINIAVGPYVCSRFRYDHVQLRRFGAHVVAMSAIADFDATMSGVDRSGRFFVTDLWRKTDDSWKVCARFSTPLRADLESIRKMVGRDW